MLVNLRKTFTLLNKFPKQHFASHGPQFVKSLSATFLLNEDPKPRKRTKTVCTIGYIYMR